VFQDDDRMASRSACDRGRCDARCRDLRYGGRTRTPRSAGELRRDLWHIGRGLSTGAYLVAGQASYGCSIYSDNINNSQFMSPLRLLSGDPLVSLKFLLEHAMIREKPLD